MSSVMESYLYIVDVRSEVIISKYPKVSVRNYAITHEEPLGGAHVGVDYHKYSEIGLDSAPVREVSAYQTVFELKSGKSSVSIVALFENHGRHGGFSRTRFYALTSSTEASDKQKRFIWEVLTNVFGIRPWHAGKDGDLDLVMAQEELTRGYLPYLDMHRYDRMRE